MRSVIQASRNGTPRFASSEIRENVVGCGAIVHEVIFDTITEHRRQALLQRDDVPRISNVRLALDAAGPGTDLIDRGGPQTVEDEIGNAER